MAPSKSVSMRLDRGLVVALLLLFPTLPTQAAEVGPGNAPVCELKLEGAIEAGDSEKLSAALSALGAAGGFDSRNVSLCLNSLGGNYDEALKLMTTLLSVTNVATVVDAGAECYSACAFLFLAGNAQRSEDGELAPNRTLDVRGTLGFHAPYLQTGTGTDVAAATIENFRRGVSAIAKMLEIDRRELIPRGLLAKALQVRSNELLYVDTIEKVGVWSIKLKGYKPPAALTSKMLDQACRNKDMWTNFSHTVLGAPCGRYANRCMACGSRIFRKSAGRTSPSSWPADAFARRSISLGTRRPTCASSMSIPTRRTSFTYRSRCSLPISSNQSPSHLPSR